MVSRIERIGCWHEGVVWLLLMFVCSSLYWINSQWVVSPIKAEIRALQCDQAQLRQQWTECINPDTDQRRLMSPLSMASLYQVMRRAGCGHIVLNRQKDAGIKLLAYCHFSSVMRVLPRLSHYRCLHFCLSSRNEGEFECQLAMVLYDHA